MYPQPSYGSAYPQGYMDYANMQSIAHHSAQALGSMTPGQRLPPWASDFTSVANSKVADVAGYLRTAPSVYPSESGFSGTERPARFGEWSWERAKQALPFVIGFPLLITAIIVAWAMSMRALYE